MPESLLCESPKTYVKGIYVKAAIFIVVSLMGLCHIYLMYIVYSFAAKLNYDLTAFSLFRFLRLFRDSSVIVNYAMV